MKTTRNFLIFFCLILNQNLNSIEENDRWKIVTEEPETGALLYVDSESIKRKNGFTYIWVLTNYQKPRQQKYYSNKAYWMVDCDLMKYKFLDVTFFEKTFGGGNVRTLPALGDKWNFASPQSIGYNILEYVCESN